MTAREEVLALENRRYKAMVEKDFAALDELLADDLVYTHSNAVVDSKTSYIEGIRSKRWDYAGAERPDEKIETFGDCARVTGHIRLTLANVDGSTRSVNGRFLNMWVRRAGKWQMVAWQSTPIPA